MTLAKLLAVNGLVEDGWLRRSGVVNQAGKNCHRTDKERVLKMRAPGPHDAGGTTERPALWCVADYLHCSSGCSTSSSWEAARQD
jgi:hypothetical protein